VIFGVEGWLAYQKGRALRVAEAPLGAD
jgi:hypothetical protein